MTDLLIADDAMVRKQAQSWDFRCQASIGIY